MPFKNNSLLSYTLLILVSFILLAVSLKSFSNFSFNLNHQAEEKSTISQQNCLGDDCLMVEGLEFPAGQLSPEAVTALDRAIDDEFHALTFYETVVAKFGMKRPFSMIKRSEEQHINSLKGIYDKYGLVIPKNPYLGKLQAPATFAEACQMGYDAEVKNYEMYQKDLLPVTTQITDIYTVFTNLMNASQLRHLVAFEKCR